MSKKVLGIDLGTSNSCVASIENGKPIVLENNEGSRTTPSVVLLSEDKREVGASANRQRIMNPSGTIFNIKRFMGSDYEKCSNVISKVPYTVKNVNSMPRVEVDGKMFSPEEISAMILQKMKTIATDKLGEEIKDVVITCPAWFDSAAREATKLAGEMCGLNVLRVINEPTAAILASNIDIKSGDKKVLVADIGGGTTDFSVCELSDGLIEVLASKGDVFLGGSDFDNALVNFVIDEFKKVNNIDLSKEPMAMARILEAAEKCKIELSNSASSEINLPYITNKDGQPLHLLQTITRSEFERLTLPLIKRIIKCGQEALEAAKITANDLDCVLLVGGQTRSIALQEALQTAFNVPLNKSVNPDEAVAIGAAIQANIIVGGEGSSDILLLDVTPLTLGIESLGGVMTPIIEANTTIPCRKTEIFTTAVDNQPSVTIRVLQGERPMANDNKQLGIFNLDGILPAKRGIPQIEVTFEIDADGILKVKANDKATNKEQSITIESKNSLTTEEIERIKQEAKEHLEEDKKTRELQEKLNKCESLIYQSENALEEMKGLTDDEKSKLTADIEKLKVMKNDKDYSELSSVESDIQTILYSASARMYQQSAQTPSESTDGNSQDVQNV